MGDPNSLYRIMPFRHVVDMFDARMLHLSSPASWEDPYEQLVQHGRQDSVFAQCWSTRETSDAMWRIYSPDRMGLSVRTSRSRLVQALEVANQTVPLQYSVMSVKYLSESETVERVNALAHEAEAAEATTRGAMAALFVKRAAFDHEAEVRAVVHLLGNSQYGAPGPSLRLPIGPTFARGSNRL